jgi:hypothetical protein
MVAYSLSFEPPSFAFSSAPRFVVPVLALLVSAACFWSAAVSSAASFCLMDSWMERLLRSMR